jgi:hypothetical protein
VLDDLAAMKPAAVVPAHGVGWHASPVMAARFEDAYVRNKRRNAVGDPIAQA